MTQSSTVNHPPHYQGACPIAAEALRLLGVSDRLQQGECIDAIELLMMGFHLGNVLKYLWRLDRKVSPVEDLQKARWYLVRWQEFDGDSWGVSRAIAEIDRISLELQTKNPLNGG